ncbi:putrescine ABC transporter permease PotI, partial [Alcaligenaceae bacterium 429]
MVRPNPWLRGITLFIGFGFLYLPILFLMVFSFNDSTLMTSWSGFSLRWYKSLMNDHALLDAAKLSFLIAGMTATAAVILGTWAGYVLARMGKFRGFAMYVGMLSAPLVIPEVVLGISLLLMFVEFSKLFGWPESNG